MKSRTLVQDYFTQRSGDIGAPAAYKTGRRRTGKMEARENKTAKGEPAQEAVLLSRRLPERSAELLVAFNTEFAALRAAEKFVVGRPVRIVARQTCDGLAGPRINNAGSHWMRQRSVSCVACAADFHCVAR